MLVSPKQSYMLFAYGKVFHLFLDLSCSLSSDLKNKASITGEGESHHDATVKAQNTDDATDGGAASGARKKKKKKKKDKPGEAAGENVKEDVRFV